MALQLCMLPFSSDLTQLGLPCCRLTRTEEDLQRKQDDFLDLRDQLERMRDDYDELRQQHTALQAQGNTREQQREMGVSNNVWPILGSRQPNDALYLSSSCLLPVGYHPPAGLEDRALDQRQSCPGGCQCGVEVTPGLYQGGEPAGMPSFHLLRPTVLSVSC